MEVTSTTSSTVSSVTSNPAGYTATKTKTVLDQSDFMKLLSTQMANQDPLNPQTDTAFIAQMASFSSLEQMTQLTSDFSLLRADQARYTATSYLGKQVTVIDDNDQTITGEVTGVDTSSDTAQLLINDTYYPLTSVTRVELVSTEPTS